MHGSDNNRVAHLINWICLNFQILVRVMEESVLSLVRRFGTVFRETLIHDRISEELRLFCANRSVDEIFIRNYSEVVPAIRRRLELRLEQMNVSNDVRLEHLSIPKPDVPDKVFDQVRFEPRTIYSRGLVSYFTVELDKFGEIIWSI